MPKVGDFISFERNEMEFNGCIIKILPDKKLLICYEESVGGLEYQENTAIIEEEEVFDWYTEINEKRKLHHHQQVFFRRRENWNSVQAFIHTDDIEKLCQAEKESRVLTITSLQTAYRNIYYPGGYGYYVDGFSLAFIPEDYLIPLSVQKTKPSLPVI